MWIRVVLAAKNNIFEHLLFELIFKLVFKTSSEYTIVFFPSSSNKIGSILDFFFSRYAYNFRWQNIQSLSNHNSQKLERKKLSLYFNSNFVYFRKYSYVKYIYTRYLACSFTYHTIKKNLNETLCLLKLYNFNKCLKKYFLNKDKVVNWKVLSYVFFLKKRFLIDSFNEMK